jgi:hypothetical protein
MGTSSEHVLKDILDRHTLRRMAWGHSYQRGEDYFTRERVRALVGSGVEMPRSLAFP